MIPYGQRKTRTRVAGHQSCGECHPPQKSGRRRARNDARRAVAESQLADEGGTP